MFLLVVLHSGWGDDLEGNGKQQFATDFARALEAEKQAKLRKGSMWKRL